MPRTVTRDSIEPERRQAWSFREHLALDEAWRLYGSKRNAWVAGGMVGSRPTMRSTRRDTFVVSDSHGRRTTLCRGISDGRCASRRAENRTRQRQRRRTTRQAANSRAAPDDPDPDPAAIDDRGWR